METAAPAQLLDGGMGLELKRRKAAGLDCAYDLTVRCSMPQLPQSNDDHRVWWHSGLVPAAITVDPSAAICCLPARRRTQLFSTAALRSTPRAVVEVHREYIAAGCDVITTASYAVTEVSGSC